MPQAVAQQRRVVLFSSSAKASGTRFLDSAKNAPLGMTK